MGEVLAPSWQGNFTNVIDRLIEMGREWIKTQPIEPAESE
jgi:hypothetical protein